MARKYRFTNHIEDVTQAKASATICYLDPDLSSANEPEDYGVAIAIGAFAVIPSPHLALPLEIHDFLTLTVAQLAGRVLANSSLGPFNFP